MFNEQGQVHMRKPSNHFDGYHWTFAKGRPDGGEHPVETAHREVGEETGYKGKIVGHIPGGFSSGYSKSHFYLMHPSNHDPSRMDHETSETKWAHPHEARKLINQSTNIPGRQRDHEILGAAVKAHSALLKKSLPEADLFKAEKPHFDHDEFERVGPQKGTNPGGTYRHKVTGEHHYIKYPQAERRFFPSEEAAIAHQDKHARNEVLASHLYKRAGVPAAETKLVKRGNVTGVASKIVQGAKENPSAIRSGKPKGIGHGFGADAWLGNYDSVGYDHDNMLVHPRGHVVRIDHGAALKFKAQGAPKPSEGEKSWGPRVHELNMLHGQGDAHEVRNAANVFSQAPKDHIHEGVKKVTSIPDHEIRGIVAQHGPVDKAENGQLASTLIARRNHIASHFSVNKGNVMQLFLREDLFFKGVGKTGASIKGTWNPGKKRYDYLSRRKGGKKPLASGDPDVPADFGPMKNVKLPKGAPRRLSLSPYMKVTSTKYQKDPATGDIRNPGMYWLRANEDAETIKRETESYMREHGISRDDISAVKQAVENTDVHSPNLVSLVDKMRRKNTKKSLGFFITL